MNQYESKKTLDQLEAEVKKCNRILRALPFATPKYYKAWEIQRSNILEISRIRDYLKIARKVVPLFEQHMTLTLCVLEETVWGAELDFCVHQIEMIEDEIGKLNKTYGFSYIRNIANKHTGIENF